MSSNQLEAIMKQVEALPVKEQEALLTHLEDLLAKKNRKELTAKESPGLVYRIYHDSPGRMSTEEDFKIAEWHPTENDWNPE